MKRQYDKIIIGATFRGCGLAAQAPADSLILEDSNLAGSDFAFCFYPGDSWNDELHSPGAEQFKEMLQANNVLVCNCMQVGALASCFAQWCLNNNLHIELLSQVLEYDENYVKVLNGSGIVEYYAEKVIDCRPKCIKRKMLTAMFKHPESKAEFEQVDKFTIYPSPYSDETYLSMELPTGATWQYAREKFYQAWSHSFFSQRNWQIVLIGTRFLYDEFANPCLALDYGLGEAQ